MDTDEHRSVRGAAAVRPSAKQGFFALRAERKNNSSLQSAFEAALAPICVHLRPSVDKKRLAASFVNPILGPRPAL
jgi:hypothetical protein